MKYALGIIGGGNMAEAIVAAAIDEGVLRPDQVIVADPTPQRRAVFEPLGVATTAENAAAIHDSEQVLLAVKPQVMDQAAKDLAEHGRADQVIISIMAGVTTAKLAGAIAEGGGGAARGGARIVRVMPNTPMMVGAGMAGIALGADARPGDDDLAMRLFSAGSSRAIRVAETQLDAITAVSGSGPAYLFHLAEAMEQAAADLGLTEHARLLVSQTLVGAAKLLAESDQSPEVLRRKVTSPGGTTQAAIRCLETNRSRGIMVEAITAACRRSEELGKE